MVFGFGRKQETPSESEDEEETFDIFQNPLCTQKWNNTAVTYHFLSIRDIAPYLSTWCFNRRIDEDHVESIKKALQNQCNPHLMSTIQLIKDKNNNCRVINGQHRIRAIQDIIREDLDMKFQMNMMFEVYDIDDLDDINANIENLFKIANNSLNYKPEDDHEILCRQIVAAMMQDPVLKNGIVDKTTGRVNKPRIEAKILFESLKSFFPSEKAKHMEVSEIIHRIKKMNVQISTTPYITLFGRYQPAVSKQKQFEKATKIGFYLNIECKMSPDVWMDMLI